MLYRTQIDKKLTKQLDDVRKGNFDESKTAFVSNLHFKCDEEELKKICADALGSGECIESIRIMKDRNTHRSRGLAYVNLANSADIDKLVETLQGKEVYKPFS